MRSAECGVRSEGRDSAECGVTSRGVQSDVNLFLFRTPHSVLRIALNILYQIIPVWGDAVTADAEAALATLRAGRSVEDDHFPFEVIFEHASPVEVRNVFGPKFTEAVFQVPLNVWAGPYTSGLGVHLVRVTDKTDRMLPPLEELHDAVLQHWRDAKSDRILAEMLEGLKAEYEVDIDEEALVRLDYAPDDIGHAP